MEDNIDTWSKKITVYDLYASDFLEIGTADSVADVLEEPFETVFVEPCEMFVIQLTMDWDFTSNWLVENEFELDNYGFVESRDIDSDDETERFRGAYAVRFPCSDEPGQTYEMGEYGQYGLAVYQSYRDDGWHRVVNFEFEVIDPLAEEEGNNMAVILGLTVVVSAAAYFFLTEA